MAEAEGGLRRLILQMRMTTLAGVVFDIGGNGSQTPYTNAVNGMVNKQLEEVKGKVNNAMNLATTWKRRLRDFMSKKNNDLLDFMKLTVPHHPVMGPAEVLLKKIRKPECAS